MSTTYLSRPVFPFPIDWADPVNKSFTYDLGEVALGFGAEVFMGLASFVAQGYTFNAQLATAADIATLDAFTLALGGPLAGFWLPAPFDAAQLNAAISSTQFSVLSQGLAATWADHPDIYLWFSAPGQTSQGAKITAVTTAAGLDTVTVDTAITGYATLFAPGATVQRLHYVRLADDKEQATFVAEGWQTRQMRVIELPLEYTTAATAQQPIYLYAFTAAAPVNTTWYYTSFAASVISGGITYAPAAIAHASFTQTTKANPETLEIEVAYNSAHPFALFIPLPAPIPLQVKILKTTTAAPDTTVAWFSGQVRSVEDKGGSLVGHCESYYNIYRRSLPRMIVQGQCNYQLYEVATCKALRAIYETTAVISSLASSALPPTIAVTLSAGTTAMQSANWFAQGFLETGVGVNYEVRTILASSYDSGTSLLTLTLNAPLQHAVVSQAVQLIPGCDGTAATCAAKFNNFVNFGGFPFVPTQNPAIQAIDQSAAAGGKK